MDVSPTQRRFFDAAMDVLAEEGYGALKLAPLCRRVGVTTGSFYHAFKSWQEFTDRFLAHWFDERTQKIADAARDVDDPRDQIDMLMQRGLALPHAAESAIRVWAGVDPEVRKLQDEVDQLRLQTVATAFAGVMGDQVAAERLAKAALYVVVGYEQAGEARDPEALEAALRVLPMEAARYVERRDA